MEIIIEIESGLDYFVSVLDCELLCHLNHFIPGLWNIIICKSGFLPHLLVVINRACHHSVINVINLAVNHMSAYSIEVLLQILNRNIKRCHIVDKILMIAVVHIKECRSVLTVECQRKLGPVIIPWIIHKVYRYIRMNCCVSVNNLLK